MPQVLDEPPANPLPTNPQPYLPAAPFSHGSQSRKWNNAVYVRIYLQQVHLTTPPFPSPTNLPSTASPHSKPVEQSHNAVHVCTYVPYLQQVGFFTGVVRVR